MKIALDAMGSDAGATPLVEGAVQAVKRYPCEVLLVGKQHTLNRLLRHFRYKGDKIHVVPCKEVVRMGEHPRESLLKKDSPIAVGARLVAEGKADALVSAGNTGTTLAHAMRSWRRLKGVKRPGIAMLMPTAANPCLSIDVGANVDCKARHLVDFALMGAVYSRQILGCSDPRVGLLCVGEERTKGNALTLETYELLEKCHLNFLGNVEPGDVFEGKVDVLVCDGFVGNVFLKTSESIAKMIMKAVKGAMTKNVLSMAGALMVSPGIRQFRKKVDHSEYGGAALVGLEHVCIIGHGGSNAKAVMNAIRVAKESVERDLNRIISQELEKADAEIGS
jgi:phosphate acyltransferase